MCKLGLVFPGQGAQYVGMGFDLYREFASVRSVFAEASRVLNMDVASLCFTGPQEALDLTMNTQTSVLTVDIAIYTLFSEQVDIKPALMAGHSLGEYSALYAAGAIGLEEVLSLVQARARHHQDAVPIGVGAMAAIIGMSCEEAEALCTDLQEAEKVVSLAIHNAPSQVVVSGHAQAVNNAVAAAKSKTAVQAIRLPISVPCHCVLLKEAAERFRSDLDRVEFRDFQVPVIPNCDPDSFHSRENTRDLLVRQITSPVRWQETIKKMADLGVDTIVELGPKRTLSNLIKRIDKRIRILNIENLESMHRTVAALKNS